MNLFNRPFIALMLSFSMVGLSLGPVYAQTDAVEKSTRAARRRASAVVRQAAERVQRAQATGPGAEATAAEAVANAIPSVETPPPPPPPPPPPIAGSGGAPVVAAVAPPPGLVEVPGEKEFNSCRKLQGNRRIVKLNLKPDTELMELVTWISAITCTQFLIPSTTVLTGKKVTIISPQLITPSEAYRLFLASIESVGLTVEPTDRFLRIVETNRARFTTLPLTTAADPLPADKRYITRLIRLRHLDAGDIQQNVLQRLKGEQGDIIAYGGDTLIITDQAVMIKKMIDIIAALDLPSGVDERIWMLRVKNTSVIEMATRLAEIFDISYVGQGFARRPGAAGASAAPAPAKPAASKKPAAGKVEQSGIQEELTISKLIPVERSNYLIVVARPLAFEWLKVMMDKLDVPLEGGHEKVHIYYCEHANCDELAVTLGAVTGIPVAITAAGRGGRGGAGAATPAAAPRPAAGAAQGQQSQTLLFEGEVRINFDRPTNSLVVVSSLKDYQAVRNIIEQLDQPRKQVFVEAVIMEVLLDKSRELGSAYHGGGPMTVPGMDRQSLLLGGFRANQTLSAASLMGGGALDGLAGAVFGPVIPQTVTGELFGTALQIPSFGLFLQALQRNNDVNVLSNPYLIITNNEEGELSVGQNIPFPGAFMGGGFGGPGMQAGALPGFLPSVSVQRQDVALKLKLVPSVNEHNMIRMEVDQEISDIASPNFGGLGPSTTKRTAKTTVVTRDQQTVLIGGLMSDRTSETVQKVPILGDIPILGFFFRHRNTTRVKTNIIIALTPYVINEPGDLRFVVEKKMRERREFIERFTAFQDNNPLDAAEVDYTRKRGMLESINRTIRELEDEERAIIQIRERDLLDQATPIELPPEVARGRPILVPGGGLGRGGQGRRVNANDVGANDPNAVVNDVNVSDNAMSAPEGMPQIPMEAAPGGESMPANDDVPAPEAVPSPSGEE